MTRLIHYFVIGLLVIFTLLGFAGLYASPSEGGSEALSVAEIQLEDARRKVVALETKNAQVEREKEAIQETLTETLDRIDLLVSLRDASDNLDLSVGDVRELLELTDRIPYGSPFKGGHIVTSGYGYRDESAINGDNWTDGIDMVPAVYGDTTVRTTADGTIVDFGFSSTYGKYIIVEHPGGFRTHYSHLSKIFWQTDDKKVLGATVNKGDRLGIMGDTGLCYSDNPVPHDLSHLDYRIEVWDGESYVTLNPTATLEYTGGTYEL